MHDHDGFKSIYVHTYITTYIYIYMRYLSFRSGDVHEKSRDADRTNCNCSVFLFFLFFPLFFFLYKVSRIEARERKREREDGQDEETGRICGNARDAMARQGKASRQHKQAGLTSAVFRTPLPELRGSSRAKTKIPPI